MAVVANIFNFIVDLIINIFMLILEIVLLPFRIIGWILGLIFGGGMRGHYMSTPWNWKYRRGYVGGGRRGASVV